MSVGVVWFRRDLRLADNPALTEALNRCERILPIYVHCPEEAQPNSPGAASRWWLHHSLTALDQQLRLLGAKLVIRTGSSLSAIKQLLREIQATHIFWNRIYEPKLIERDKKLKKHLQQKGIACISCNGLLLREPWEVHTKDNRPFRIFTPFWRAHRSINTTSPPLPPPKTLRPVLPETLSLKIDDIKLLPDIRWDHGLYETWQPGEKAAQAALNHFLASTLASYDEGRDRPDKIGTSRLSPHLHFGELSPRQVINAIENYVQANQTPGLMKSAECYIREIGWREFAYHLLYHFPHTTEAPLDGRFSAFPWQSEYSELLSAWQTGKTGFPIIDAGMRELWYSGWMHNRVRMIVASFLTKNLRIPWKEGERWFWDTLVDADLASNTLGWQWTAGCGADAAPYFRIFNPVLQGKRHDPHGDYVGRWLPELAALPAKIIHQPWSAPAEALRQYGLSLGDNYPSPIVDLRQSRQQALAAYEQIKRTNKAPV